jgi:hypothetical protein
MNDVLRAMISLRCRVMPYCNREGGKGGQLLVIHWTSGGQMEPNPEITL